MQQAKTVLKQILDEILILNQRSYVCLHVGYLIPPQIDTLYHQKVYCTCRQTQGLNFISDNHHTHSVKQLYTHHSRVADLLYSKANLS